MQLSEIKKLAEEFLRGIRITGAFGGDVYLYKDPSKGEYKSFDTYKKDKEVRGLISKGILFAWGEEIFHDRVKEEFNISGEKITIYGTLGITAEIELTNPDKPLKFYQDLILNHESLLILFPEITFKEDVWDWSDD